LCEEANYLFYCFRKTSLEVENDTKLLNVKELEKEISKLKGHLEKSQAESVEKLNR